MGLFSGIKGLFGSSKNVETIVETGAKGLYNGIDMLKFTSEEKAISEQKIMDKFLKFADIAYEQNSIRSITRRWLAFMIIGPAVLSFVASGVFFVLGIFLFEMREGINPVTGINGIWNPGVEAGKFLFEMFKALVPWAGGVLIFYFGPHIIGAKNAPVK